jgi:hypothetical protein
MYAKPINYRAYLLRLWKVRSLDGDGQAKEWRASLEEPHTGERLAFATLAALYLFGGSSRASRGKRRSKSKGGAYVAQYDLLIYSTSLSNSTPINKEIAIQRFFRFRSGWMMGLLLTSLMSVCQPIQSTTAPANDQAATTMTDTVTSTANATEAPLPEVIFVAKEYSFAGPERIPSGWTQITLDNQGELSHD